MIAEIAALTRAFVQGWTMPDQRYRTCLPDAPYASYLLYLHPDRSLSIGLDVFLPGQAAAIHNHLTWGVIACLSGCERERRYRVPADLGGPPIDVGSRFNQPGGVISIGSGLLDFHQVECAGAAASESLHIYGMDIGRLHRLRWDRSRGRYVGFASDWSNTACGLGAYLPTLE